MGDFGTATPENDVLQLAVALLVLICRSRQTQILFEDEVNSVSLSPASSY